jgi:uncharacterized protein
LRHAFDSFEPYPADSSGGAVRNSAGKATPRKRKDQRSREADEAAEYSDADAAVIRLAAQGLGLEINPGALAWEEFSLALPVKPLCRANCKGLCPTCGCNRNHESCACATAEVDLRLAGLRGLNILKK